MRTAAIPRRKTRVYLALLFMKFSYGRQRPRPRLRREGPDDLALRKVMVDAAAVRKTHESKSVADLANAHQVGRSVAKTTSTADSIAPGRRGNLGEIESGRQRIARDRPSIPGTCLSTTADVVPLGNPTIQNPRASYVERITAIPPRIPAAPKTRTPPDRARSNLRVTGRECRSEEHTS